MSEINSPSAGNQPPVIPPQLPVSKKQSSIAPLVIILVCVAVLVAFAGVGLFALMLFRAKAVAQVGPGQHEVARARAVVAPTREANLPAGLTYVNDKIPSEPWSIHVLKIDRSRKDLTFYSAHARGKVLGVSLLADQARAVPPEIGRALAGVNGDFYIRDAPPYSGDPRGLQIVNGELISAPDTVCIWFDANETPHLDEVKGDFNITWADGRKIRFGLNQQRQPNAAVLYTPTYGASTFARGGRELILERDGNGPWLPLQASQSYRARVRDVSTNGNTTLVPGIMVLSLAPSLLAGLPEATPGTTLEISTATAPDLAGAKAAMAGGPALLKDGKAVFTLKTPPADIGRNYSERSKYERHPRSAAGWNATHFFMVIVDGRQPGLSMGMKLAELADYFVKLGCTDAMNLDGGKSAQMWMDGRIMNSPCQGEDTVASSLLVVRKPVAR